MSTPNLIEQALDAAGLATAYFENEGIRRDLFKPNASVDIEQGRKVFGIWLMDNKGAIRRKGTSEDDVLGALIKRANMLQDDAKQFGNHEICCMIVQHAQVLGIVGVNTWKSLASFGRKT